MTGILKVFHNIIRGFVRLAFRIPIAVTCLLIKAVTYEPGKSNVITERKAARIRALSKFKIFVLNAFPDPVNRYLGLDGYKIYLNEHLKDGLQLRYE